MPAPALKPWFNTTKNEYYVRVIFNDGLHPPERRFTLRTADASIIVAAIEDFRERELPALLRDRNPAADAAGTIRDAYSWYIGKYLPDLGRAQKTLDAYDRILHDFTTFCRVRHIGRVQQVTPDLFRDWQAQRSAARNGNTTAKRDELLCVRHFFDVCAEQGKLPELTMKWTIPGKVKSRRFRALDTLELRAIHEALSDDPPRPHLLLRWHLLTPWLPSDVIDLRGGECRGDYIDRDRIKTSRQMLYPVTPAMAAIIAQATDGRTVKRAEHIFLNDGAAWEYTQLEKQTRWWQKRHGFDFTFRDLRVTFATRLANAGCPPSVLAELMGHENIETTLQYYVRVDLLAMGQWAAQAPDLDLVPAIARMYPVQENMPDPQ